MHLEPETADLNAFLLSIMDFMGAELKESGISQRLELEKAFQRHPSTRGSSSRPSSTSSRTPIAAMPSGGELTVSTCRKDDDVLIRSPTRNGHRRRYAAKNLRALFHHKETGLASA
jgi:hypothetical protein